jgi:hypothetical protein
MAKTLEKIGVIGAGTMGNGIAQVSAAAGLEVVMIDVTDAAVQRGLTAVGTSLDRLVKKDKLSGADRAASLARIRGSTQYSDLASADLVIEAATENLDIKRRIMKQADEIMRPEAVLATNTSSISITALAASTSRADRFIGMHFFNPVPLMALVELIRGLLTSEETHSRAAEFIRRIGKTGVSVKNSPGFAVNRALSDDQRGDLRLAGRRGQRGGHRRRHEARMQPSDWTAGARGSGGARHPLVRDGGVPAGFRRSEVPSGAALARNGGGGAARPQERARLL